MSALAEHLLHRGRRFVETGKPEDLGRFRVFARDAETQGFAEGLVYAQAIFGYAREYRTEPRREAAWLSIVLQCEALLEILTERHELAAGGVSSPETNEPETDPAPPPPATPGSSPGAAQCCDAWRWLGERCIECPNAEAR